MSYLGNLSISVNKILCCQLFSERKVKERRKGMKENCILYTRPHIHLAITLHSISICIPSLYLRFHLIKKITTNNPVHLGELTLI